MTFQRHHAWVHDGHKVIQNAIGDILVENAFVSKLLQIKLEAFKFHTLFVGNVPEDERPKIRLPGLGAHGRELRALDFDVVFPVGKGIVKAFKLVLERRARHSISPRLVVKQDSRTNRFCVFLSFGRILIVHFALGTADRLVELGEIEARVIRISEIFHSVQGEGLFTGTPSVFIRTSGCNLRCWFCDTKYSSWDPEGDFPNVDEIVADALKWDTPHVVITGGEPMIFEELPELCGKLRDRNRHITIETAGTIHRDTPCDLWSISPKLSNSTPVGFATEEWVNRHDARRHQPEVVRKLMAQAAYQLKFVVGSILDAEEVLHYLAELGEWDRDRVMLMPRGTTAEELRLQSSWLASWCRDHHLRLCDRSHIYWFGNKRGT